MIDAPIWMDTIYQAPASGSPFSYTVELSGGTLVFRGKAWAAPEEEYINIKVNTLCQNYLSLDFPNISAVGTGTTTFTHPEAMRTFILRDYEGNALETYQFLLDWSYGRREGDTLSEPINKRGTNGMYYFSTSITGGTVKTKVTMTAPSGWTTDYCGPAALYYVNRLCGIDSFLCEGACKRTDTYTRYDITKPYNNTTLEWGRKNYNNQIQPSWELVTGWLSDSQSDNLAFNLLSSNQVFLHLLNEDRLIPVTLNETQARYKTYKGEGGKMVNYTITVTASQTEQNIN